jgi:hypothetical protein
MSSEIKVDTISENTSANGVVIDSVTLKDGTITSTVADNSDNLTLISTDADANFGPNLRLYRNSSSPADSDFLGTFEFEGRNDNSQDVIYVQLTSLADDVSDGTEDGSYIVSTIVGGTSRNRMAVRPTETIFNEDSVDLDFRVESNGLTHALFVDAGNDRVGIGTSSLTTRLGVQQDVHNEASFEVKHSGNGSSNFPYGMVVRFPNSNRDNNVEYFYYATDSSSAKFAVWSDGDVQNHDNSYGAISDERIKQDIRDSNSQWDDIKAVKVRNFKKKDDVRQYGDKAWEQIGVIAQELEDAGMDKLVKESDPTPSDVLSDASFGTLYEDGDTIPDGKQIGDVKEVKQKVKGVSYSVLYMKAIKALQEAMTRIETLEAEVTALKGE